MSDNRTRDAGPFRTAEQRVNVDRAITHLHRAALCVRQFPPPISEEARGEMRAKARRAAQHRSCVRSIARNDSRRGDANLLDYVKDGGAHERRAFFVLPGCETYLVRLRAVRATCGPWAHWQRLGAAKAIVRLSLPPEVLAILADRGLL